MPLEWEEADCLMCGSRRWVHLLEAPDPDSGLRFRVVQCRDCRLCFTNPRPTRETIARFYPPDYRPHRLPPRRSRFSLRRWLGTNLRQTLPWHGQGRLLDFGCGGGSYLHRLHQQGWQATGLDISTAAVARVRRELGHPILAGSLPHPDLAPASFDVVTMWQSLEHVHAPRDVLQETHRLLTPGGKLIVAVPNIDSLPFRWFGEHWFGLDLPRHLTHFTPDTLTRMLLRTGFRVGRVKTIRHSEWLRTSARLTCRSGGAFWQRLLTTRSAARLATSYSRWTGQSDCILVTACKA